MALGFEEDEATGQSQVLLQPLFNHTKTGILQLGISPSMFSLVLPIKGDITLIQYVPSMQMLAVTTNKGHFCLLNTIKPKKLEPYQWLCF